jgi:hypothetical protein
MAYSIHAAAAFIPGRVPFEDGAGNQYDDVGVILGTSMMTPAMQAIDKKSDENPVEDSQVSTNADLSGSYAGADGERRRAINLKVNTTLTINGDVTVITTEAMTISAVSEIELVGDVTVTCI